MKMNNTARSITAAAIVGAAYAALTMLLAPISYGAIQVRVSEALCILPYFLPCTAWGLFAGCAIANVLTGNIFDIIFGSLATLAAVLTAARLGRGKHTLLSEFLACSANVVINAIVIGHGDRENDADDDKQSDEKLPCPLDPCLIWDTRKRKAAHDEAAGRSHKVDEAVCGDVYHN